MNFKGTVSVDGDSGDPVPVTCEITDTRLIVTARDGSVIGSWRIDELSVAQTAEDVVVQVDGETLTLAVQESESLASALRTTTGSSAAQPASGVKETPADSGQLQHAPQSQQNWHGIKRCITGAKIPKGNRVMGNACPFCGNTLGAAIGSRIQSNAPTSDKLDRLNELHDSGHLTDEEYSSRRDRILDDAVATGPPQVSETQNVPSSPVRQSSRRPRKAWLIVAAVAVVIFGLISWAYSTIPKPPEPGPFTIELLNYRAENPASLVVRYDVTNHGPVAGNYRCRISASDPSNTYHGFGTFRSNTPLQAGATERATSALVITKEGAEYVTRVETSGCE